MRMRTGASRHRFRGGLVNVSKVKLQVKMVNLRQSATGVVRHVLKVAQTRAEVAVSHRHRLAVLGL